MHELICAPCRRYNGQESFREPAIYQGNVDLEAQAKLGLTAISNANANAARAIRRWNSVSSLASENSLYTVGCHAAAGPLVSQSSMLSNMSASDSQALMQSLQMLCQASHLLLCFAWGSAQRLHLKAAILA